MTAIIALIVSVIIAASWMRFVYKLPWITPYHSQKPVDAWIVTHVIWGVVYYLVLRWLGFADLAMIGTIALGAGFELVENCRAGIAVVKWLGDGRFRGDSVLNAAVDIVAVAAGGWGCSFVL